MSDGERPSFPRQQARTRRFTLGQPRSFSIAPDGSRVAFLRSASGTDPLTSLWCFDVENARERLVCDASALADAGAEIPREELARRERVRESAEGVVAYATDRDVGVAAFAVNGSLFRTDLVSGETASIETASGVIDPRPSPDGERIAYASGGALRVVGLDGDRLLAGEGDPNVTWGLAEFVAAEEMGRTRGSWWSPESDATLAARVDVSAVRLWHIANPAVPEREPVAVRYPAAGTPNADVTLAIWPVDGTPSVEVDWDRGAFPYVVRVAWSRGRPPLVVVQSRDQRSMLMLEVDVASGSTSTRLEAHDPDWVELVPGAPAWLDDGRLVSVIEDRSTDTRRLGVDGEAVTPPGLQVTAVADAGADVVFTAVEEPAEQHVWRLAADGRVERLTDEPGVHAAVANGRCAVIVSSSLERNGARARVVVDGRDAGEIASLVDEPLIEPRARLVSLGSRGLRSAILLPSEDPGAGPLPVLLDPYGGPHSQRVLSARGAFLASQWFADQGFAVLVADGRGTPARGLSWEKSVAGDLATPALEDQVDALHEAARIEPRLDLSRVAIRGWSFGGYLAALAVLRRPDVFHAAVAGAPVTDWRLYDTHYTERYLGDPNEQPAVYRRSSLLDEAANLERPMMLIHGLADDNVVVAHTLRLSQALMEAGRPHTVLPLTGVTHMTPQETVAENLLLLQVAFLRNALGLDHAADARP